MSISNKLSKYYGIYNQENLEENCFKKVPVLVKPSILHILTECLCVGVCPSLEDRTAPAPVRPPARASVFGNGIPWSGSANPAAAERP